MTCTYRTMIFDVHVFPAGLLHSYPVMKGASRPDSINASSLSVLVYIWSAVLYVTAPASILTPGIAVLLPDSALEPALSMIIELIGDILLGDKVFNVVKLHLGDDLEGVGHESFKFASDTSTFNWRVWTKVHCFS